MIPLYKGGPPHSWCLTAWLDHTMHWILVTLQY